MAFDLTSRISPQPAALAPPNAANSKNEQQKEQAAPFSAVVNMPRPNSPDPIGKRIYVGDIPDSPDAQGAPPQSPGQNTPQGGNLPLPSWLFKQNAVQLPAPQTNQQQATPPSAEQPQQNASTPATSPQAGQTLPPAPEAQQPQSPQGQTPPAPQATKQELPNAPGQSQQPKSPQTSPQPAPQTNQQQGQAPKLPQQQEPSPAKPPQAGASSTGEPNAENPNMQAWWNRNKESKPPENAPGSEADSKASGAILTQDTIRSLNIRLNNNQESIRADASMEFFQLLEGNAIADGPNGPPYKSTLDQNPQYQDYVDAFLQKILNDPSPIVREMIVIGLGNGYVSEVSASVYHTLENMLSQGGGPFGVDRSDIEKALAHVKMRQEAAPEKPSRSEQRRTRKAENQHQHSSGAFSGQKQSQSKSQTPQQAGQPNPPQIPQASSQGIQPRPTNEQANPSNPH